jgi:2'-5' RNA ligase
VSETLRLFIALELPPDVVAALRDMQHRLQRSGAHPVKWVAPDAFHLTLQFLGAVATAQVPALCAALRPLQQAPAHSSSHMQLAVTGAFPNLRRPQTLWVGVGGATAQLAQLAHQVGQALVPLGFAPDTRPFRAHLTIGRVRQHATPAQRRELGAAIAALPAPPAVTWPITTPILFQSTLTPDGAHYQRIDV